ncbi:PrsW family intramembrane metalloprotease [Candidatus Gracilibacteria bacterium]|nr:PrsW family intramembrane metalloprotease [Candidatus Gracilibacteria bacterium]MCF7856417.1 PrsW family intramembrane metalloprotease [Candidatus Gracilibacteria bacterium]MCF7896290.1 PrsW family intramembrane metalloprotease [Candidatus Gracilibacteria bacterium]
MNEINLAPDFIDRIADALSRVAGIFDVAHLPFIGLAAVPVIIWLYIFLRHQRENKLLTLGIFLAGMLAVIPIFVFQHEITRIDGILENLFVNIVLITALTGLWVGFYEETSKMWIVKLTGKSFFRNIDDAIQLSIIVALGFSFIENVLYFHSIWNNPAIDESMRWFYVTFRSIGSMLLHIIASGIFGYYYGVACFAKPVLVDKLSEGKRFIFTKWIHRILHMKSETVFREEKIFEGLLMAASIHAIFDFLMGMSQYFTDADAPEIARIFLLTAVPFLVGCFFWLTYLLDKKEDHKTYCEIGAEDVLEKDCKIRLPSET